MYPTSSETKELRKMYNFNSADDSFVSPESTNQFSATNENRLEDVDMRSEEGSVKDQQIDDDNNTSTTGGVVEGPSAFAPEKSSPSAQEASNNITFEEKPVDIMKNNGKGSAGKKLDALKVTFGLDNGNTEGKTPAEKQKSMLEERWRKAMLEEGRLNALDVHVSRSENTMQSLNLTPNFPPKFLCLKPVVHHDLETIPEPRKRYVKLCYGNWLVTCALLLVNMIVAIGVGFAPRRSNDSTDEFNQIVNTFLAIAYIVGGPLSFIVWYWPIYISCSTGRHTRYLLSLSGLIVAIGFSVFALIGQTSCGVCGIQLAVHLYATRNPLVVIPVAIVCLFWVSEAVFLCYCFFRQFKFYRHDVKAKKNARSMQRNEFLFGV